MAQVVYILCALTSIICALALFRGYQATRTRLLFWSFLCFAGLAISNILLFVDLFAFPDVTLAPYRSGTALVSLLLLLFGLIWEIR